MGQVYAACTEGINVIMYIIEKQVRIRVYAEQLKGVSYSWNGSESHKLEISDDDMIFFLDIPEGEKKDLRVSVCSIKERRDNIKDFKFEILEFDFFEPKK